MTLSLPNLTRTVLALALCAPVAAVAQESPGPVSADPELLNPRFGYNTVPGVPVPDTDVKNTVRFGVIFQYQRNPVTGYRLDQEVGTIIANRMVGQFGVSLDFAEWGSARLVVPLNANWGTQIPALGENASGAGLGDITAGVSFAPVRSRFFNFGVQADAFLPTGRSEAFMGEKAVRLSGGIMMMGSVFEYFDIMANASVLWRPIIVTNQDFDYGPELLLGQAARLKLPWIPFHFTQTLMARGGFTNFFQGGAENGLELMGGIQYPIENIAFNTKMTIDVMAGRGTNQGYGTTDFRLLGGVTFTRNPGRKIVPIVIDPPPPEPPALVQPPEIEPPPVEQTGSAIRTKDQIVIKDPIEFLVDTANILPHSLPVVSQVADILNSDYRINHVVIEGHASAEGNDEYNYELSGRRARAIYEQLIRDGVHPDRISYKGWGEVRPKVEGEDEEAYKVNRRVEFHIVSLYDDRLPYVQQVLEEYYTDFPIDPPPSYSSTVKLPWNGANQAVVVPQTAAEVEAERKAEEARKAEEQRRRDNFQEEEDNADFDFEAEDEAGEEEEEEDVFGDESFDDFDEPETPVEEVIEEVEEAVEESVEEGEDAGTGESAEEESDADTEEAAASPVEQAESAVREAAEEMIEDSESEGADEADAEENP